MNLGVRHIWSLHMKALKFCNLILASVLAVAIVIWSSKGNTNTGGLIALLLPAIAFATCYAALQSGSKRLASAALVLNALLLIAFIAIDAFALLVANTPVNDVLTVAIFQAFAIALPAVSNIFAMRRLNASTP